MSKQIRFAAVLTVLCFGLVGLAAAQAARDTPASVNDVLSEIRAAQKISGADQINVSQATDDQLERLGAAVVQEHLGNSRMHDWVEGMMGGAGSRTLADVNRRIGERFLNGSGGGMLMSPMMGRRWRGWSPADSSWVSREIPTIVHAAWRTGFVIAVIFSILVLVILVLAIILIIRALSRTPATPGSGALEILKQCYARGEISKQEYEDKKHDLT